jgi:hypothetical protein
MRSIMRQSVLAATLACALSVGALAGAAAPASAGYCGGYSLKDDGQTQGGSGYYLTVVGHNQIVRTTGTGGCWQFFPAVGGGFVIDDLNTSLCLNVLNGVVYADSCEARQKLDPDEAWTLKIEPDGANVYQNVHDKLNLTAQMLKNGAEVVTAGGPTSPTNLWWQTLIN